MARRISRAKQAIKDSGIAFAIPPGSVRQKRLGAVLHVLYLIFNEGYVTTSGPHLQRHELAAEAIRLTRMVHRLLPDDAEVTGLLALMLLTDARRAARTGPDGSLIAMDEQDRGLWDGPQIAEGVALIQLGSAARRDRALPAPGRDRRPARRGGLRRRDRLAADPGDLRGAAARLGHPAGAAQPRGRCGDGLRTRHRAGTRRPDGQGRPLADDHRLAVRAHLLERSGDLAGARTAYRGRGARRQACRSSATSTPEPPGSDLDDPFPHGSVLTRWPKRVR